MFLEISKHTERAQVAKMFKSALVLNEALGNFSEHENR